MVGSGEADSLPLLPGSYLLTVSPNAEEKGHSGVFSSLQ